MKAKEIDICDLCNSRKANFKCNFCGIDLCRDCSKYINIKVYKRSDGDGYNGIVIEKNNIESNKAEENAIKTNPFILCFECYDKIEKHIKEKDTKNILKGLIEVIKKDMIIEEL